MREHVAEFKQATADAGLYGAERLGKFLRDFQLRQAAEERELDGALLLERQGGDSRADGARLIAEGGRGVGADAGVFIIAEIGGERGGEQFAATATRPHAIDGAVADESDGPGEGRAAF